MRSIYFVLVDRFANADRSNNENADPISFHGGDLRGVTDRLGHIQNLGLGTVWLSPISLGRTAPFLGHGAFHGYWVQNLGALDPRFGTLEDLRRLREALEERSMTLLLDAVLNHVDYDAPLVREHPDWFHTRGPIQDWQDPAELEHGAVHGLPDLAQGNPEVFDYLVRASRQWVTWARPAGFRLDAVRHIGVEFWQPYARAMRAAAGSDFVLLGEIFEGSPPRLSRTWKDGGFTHAFDFPLYYALIDVFCRGADLRRLGAILFEDRQYEDPNALVTFLDNHDLPRIATACGGDLARVGHAIDALFTLRGVPSITYGTEFGMQGRSEPENRASIDWTAQAPLAPQIAQAAQRRAASPALSRGRTWIASATAEQIVLVRIAGNDAVLVRIATGATATVPALPGPFDALLQITPQSAPVEEPVQVVPLVPRSGLTAANVAARLEAFSGRTASVELVAPAEGLERAARLVVTGSGPELGDWDPHHGVEASALPSGRARATVELPVGGVFAFKSAGLDGTDTAVWPAGTDRYVFVPWPAGD